MESVDELVVFEPGHERFTVVHGTRLKATTVEFAQLRQFLRVAETEADKYLEELKQSSVTIPSKTEATALAFQLDPKLRMSLTIVRRNSCTLTSPQFTYKVRCETLRRFQKSLRLYLQYADWTSRLNYVLHPENVVARTAIGIEQGPQETPANSDARRTDDEREWH